MRAGRDPAKAVAAAYAASVTARALRRRLLPVAAGMIVAFGTFATVAAGFSAAPTPAQVGLAVLGSVIAGGSSFVGASLYLRREAKADEAPVRSRPVVPVTGALPRATAYFTGRERLLEELREDLRRDGVAVLTGLGGVGKTQVAVAYARRHWEAAYDLIWWVRAEQPAVLAEDYAALADAQKLCAPTATSAKKTAAARRWLEATGRWLLVFDNAEDAATLEPYLPQTDNGHVLVTSRTRSWPEATVEVPPWARSESVAFLRTHTAADASTADALAEVLGDLPLALEQARAYLRETGRSADGYLDDLRSRASELLAEGTPSRYPHTVATTWSLALDQIQQAPGARELLALWAFLGPDDIPRALPADHATDLPRRLRRVVTDRLAYDRAVAALGRYSLAAVTEDTVTVHRLVQSVVRERLDKRDRRRWARTAVRLVGVAFPSNGDDVDHWPACARLLPHALAAAKHATTLGIEQEATSLVLGRAGAYLWGRAEFDQAKALLEQALAIDEARLGPDHPNVAARLSNLGLVLHDVGNLEAARSAHKRALAVREARLGPDHPDVATSLSNLGTVLHDLGDLEDARGKHEQALAIRQARFGPNHPDVATSRANLQGVLDALNERGRGPR